ncbi:MAG: prephenate dehydratase [Propionibacteriaceae bacterium]|jgi:prephenate dehydratase|nr:prephenate dehydratase [Propionibacteriaceae bacterium]
MLGYFGPEGTFTHQALLTLNIAEEAKPYASVGATLDAVRNGEVRAGLVPIENSVEGGVSATIDNLAAGEPVWIIAEVLLPVRFGLYVRPGHALADVRRVITHPHAAAQVRDWLAVHVPDAVVTTQGSTAGAAAEVSKVDSPFDAAVCATVAGELYGLVPVASDIADNPDAVTRFILVARPGTPAQPSGYDKTSVMLHLNEDHPGALMEILEQFTLRGVNLCRIESRPEKDKMGNYYFSIDAEGHVRDPRMQEALKGLHRTCREVTFLGSYPRADKVKPGIRPGTSDADFASAEGWLSTIMGDSQE